MKAYAHDYVTGKKVPIDAASIRFLLDNGREIEVRLTGTRDKDALEISVPSGGILVVRPSSTHAITLKVEQLEDLEETLTLNEFCGEIKKKIDENLPGWNVPAKL